MIKKLYIAATRQNEGKTMVSLGIISAFKERGYKVGFIKPVGQRYVSAEGYIVDEDSYLIDQAHHLGAKLPDTSPITVGKGFTAKYIDNPDVEPLLEKVKASFDAVSEDKDVVIIEGTGHAGVGSTFDLSNAAVAKFLGAKVVLISSGGIGRPIDEIMLNKAVFEQHGVELLGAIINKVYPEKLDKIRTYVSRGLARLGVELFGVLPERKALSYATMRQIMQDIGAELINGEAALDQTVEKALVGAMTPHLALNFFGNKSLIITPGDREDIILAAMSSSIVGDRKSYRVSGICLTGGTLPHKTIMELIKRTEIPVIAVNEDTYTAASHVHDLVVKIRPNDHMKIQLASELIREHVNIDLLVQRLAEPVAASSSTK